MAIARHGTGVSAVARAFASQVHPVFMLPPVAASLFGAALAGPFDPAVAVVHAAAMFCAVYTAHVKDGYVDFYLRGEDDDHPLSALGCRLGLVAAAVGFAACLGWLALAAGPLAAAVTLPTWFVGYLHAPQFDTNPVTTTLGYPLGVALCILGGYVAQTGGVAARPLAFAGVFLIVLAGVKVVDDSTDYEYDRSIGKRSVAVALGRDGARSLAYALMSAGLFAVVPLTITGVFPPSSPVASLLFGAVVAAAYTKGPKTATMLLVRGAYVFLAALLVAVFFSPLAGTPLPDITVLGPYTYLATEVAFGAVAFALLARAGALRRAAVTVAAVYPVAYVWDWYTLEVGVFEITMRTGINVLAIPLEEHLFMVVVPALVLAVHETLADA